MPNRNDPETLKIPAFMRKHAIVSQARQKLILTALDRKEAGVSLHSTRKTAPLPAHKPVPQQKISPTPRKLKTGRRAAIADETDEISSTDRRKQLLSPTLNTKKLAHIGEVTHYLEKIDVAIIKLTSALKSGEVIFIEGDGYMFVQEVEEMQIDRKPVKTAKKGSHIGLKVDHAAHVKGKVYRLPS